jgi:hypothetical protein
VPDDNCSGKLITQIEMIQQFELSSFKAMVDVGNQFFMQAQVYVDVRLQTGKMKTTLESSLLQNFLILNFFSNLLN